MRNDVLSHLAFFEALADEASESSRSWHEHSAGLLALRLYDSWDRARRRVARPPEAAHAMAVRYQVEALDPYSPVRAPLLSMVAGIMDDPVAPVVIRNSLVTYAQRLRHQGNWRLAADVFRTALESREPGDISAEAYQAAMECGYCSRMSGDLEEAAVAYDVGEAIAMASRDTFGSLRAQVGKAKLTIHRGNLPQAEAELEAIAQAAEGADCQPALSLALAERMAVAGQRGQFEAAAVFGYRALEHCSDSTTREAIMSDLATALGDAGESAASRDLHLVLSATAQDTRVRWLSTANLLVLAARDGATEAFESYRRMLDDAPLPVELRARYALALGESYELFGDTPRAIAALEEAASVAGEYQVNEVLVRAEVALQALRRREHVEQPVEEVVQQPVHSGGVSLETVVRGARAMRERMVGDQMMVGAGS